MLKGLPEPLVRDFIAVRPAYRKVFCPSIDTFVNATKRTPYPDRKSWEQEICDRFKAITGQLLEINRRRTHIPEGAEAIAQRKCNTKSTHIGLKSNYSLYTFGHELVHAIQNTFNTLLDPVMEDSLQNAFGPWTIHFRGALHEFNDLYVNKIKNGYTHSTGGLVKAQLEGMLRNLPVAERKQIRLHFLEEWQAQSISVKWLKPKDDADTSALYTHSRESNYADTLKVFAGWLAELEQKLAEEEPRLTISA